MTQYVGIRSEGGLIPYDVLDKIAKEESGLGQQAKDFGLPAGRRLTDEIARAWSDAQDYWHIFQRRTASLPESETGTTLTRKWISDLLNEQLLGYELTYQLSGAVIGGKNYPISHRAGSGEESPPIQVEGFRNDLDRRPEGRRLSPQALVQEYLNYSDSHLWGIVSNGCLLRLLRDTSRTSRPSYLEFDLQSILDGNRFNEFALFYRICHRSRLPRTAEDSTSCWLEKYFQLSIEQGGRVRDKLRDGVEDALKTLGTGFLRHPRNEVLRDRVKTGTLTAAEFHRQLLRLVYRLLFLMVAEERRMIVPEGPEADRRQNLFDRYYSVGRLRNLAEKAIEPSTFGDLWIGLQQTFALFEDGDSNPLGIPPLNGDLFSTLAVKDLQGTYLYNDVLLAAMGRLSLFEDRRVRQRVNYSALDVEELGSVYESLLDFQPVFIEQSEGLSFELRIGSERKSTGSYYTRPELVRELVESALVPVLQDRLAAAKDADSVKEKERKQQAILSMSVCDPACGSGHFLLAAARRLGRELAKVRTGEEEPTPKEFHLAVRDVIAHCIYGVDLNPLAVDLCKLALWLESHWTGKPLSFLDHRIKCGNSLIGVLDPNVLDEGVPDGAFNAVSGDDKEVAKAAKKSNREERRGQPSLPFDAAQHVRDYAREYHNLADIVEETPAGVRNKAKAYEAWRGRDEWWHDWTACNIWTAAFFVPLTKFDDPIVPTYERLLRFVQRHDSQPQMAAAANAVAEQLRFFHWRIEFPEVFERGQFDVVLGNPPWELLQPEELKFFSSADATQIGSLAGAKRKAVISELTKTNAKLAVEWEAYKRTFEGIGKYARQGGRFPLTTVGKLNTYTLFAELASSVVSKRGRAGLVLPTGVVTDESNKNFFSELVNEGRLVQVVGFENESFIFTDVHNEFKFCALTLAGSNVCAESDFVFYCRYFQDVLDPARHFKLGQKMISLVNPNTKTCPIFRTGVDSALATKIYTRVPVLVRHADGGNAWETTLRQGLFNLTSDSGEFRTRGELETKGFELKQNVFSNGSETYLPLYEAKMIWQYDHRFASLIGTEESGNRPSRKYEGWYGVVPTDPQELPLPRYWVSRGSVEEQLRNWKRPWLLVFRDITNSVAERSSIFSLLPRVGVGNSAPIVYCDKPADLASCLLAIFNSLVFDYAARQKIAGTHLNFFILEQLPVLLPTAFEMEDRRFISNRVLELVYTAVDLKGFAGELGYDGPPFEWQEKRRAAVQAEIDAYLAHLYGLTRDELRFILDPKEVFGEEFPGVTFKVLKQYEMKDFGEFRTRRLVLEAFDELAESSRFREEMSKRESAIEASKVHTTVPTR